MGADDEDDDEEEDDVLVDDEDDAEEEEEVLEVACAEAGSRPFSTRSNCSISWAFNLSRVAASSSCKIG